MEEKLYVTHWKVWSDTEDGDVSKLEMIVQDTINAGFCVADYSFTKPIRNPDWSLKDAGRWIAFLIVKADKIASRRIDWILTGNNYATSDYD